MTALSTLGRYEIVAELGKGAMGVVYKADDPMLNRTVAIKTINMAEAEQDGVAEYEARFLHEAKAAGGLNHPNIIIVYDIGKSGSLVYMAMEYVEGKELRHMLTQGQTLPITKAADIAAQVADGLAYAHEHHVIHRDIKPANILITPDGRAKIADFGIARMRSTETRTQTGVIMGSPKYLSPEQVVGKRADHRSDIFSLGVILYQCLTGATPFNGEGLSALMYQIEKHDPAPPSSINPKIPIMLDYILAKVLAKSPESRYQSATDLAKDLRDLVKHMESSPAAGADLGASRPIAKPAGAPADEPVAADPGPTKGISRAFDSHEATMRLMRQLSADGTTVEFMATPIASQTSGTRTLMGRLSERPWGIREHAIFAATVVVALVIATAVVLL